MTPSILAPLGAAPTTSTSVAGTDDVSTLGSSRAEDQGGTPFRDLVAQEQQQSQGDTQDPLDGQEAEASSNPAGTRQNTGGEESARDDAGSAGQGEHTEQAAAPGGQPLPLLAASTGLTSAATSTDLPAPSAPSTSSTGASAASAVALETPASAAPTQAQLKGNEQALTRVSGDFTTVKGQAPADGAAGDAQLAQRPLSGAQASAMTGRQFNMDHRGRDTMTAAANARLDGARMRSASEQWRLEGLRAPTEVRSLLNTFQPTPTFDNPSTATSTTAPISGTTMPAALAPTPVTYATAPSTALSSSPSTFELTQALGSQEWQQELGGRLQWMADARLGRAELRMNPPELGPLEITLNVRGEEVSATFQAQHAATREAVEQALPRLREMMAQSGLQLADANVGQQQSQDSPAQNPSDQGRSAAGQGTLMSAAEAELHGPLAPSVRLAAGIGQGGVDLYA